MRYGALHGIGRLTRRLNGATLALAVISLLAAYPVAARAAEPASELTHVVHSKASVPLSQQVVVADQLVMVIEAPSGGHTAAERVDAVNDRLVEIISTERLIPSDMRLAKLHGQTVIMVGKHLLISVTSADAAANYTTVPVLAHFWLANLKRILPQARPAARLP